MLKPTTPIVLTIAGHDPCGGAGLSADLKVFEAIGLTGMSVCTAITYQNEDTFEDVVWISKKKIKKQLEVLLEKYPIDYVKIGIIEDMDTLVWVVNFIKSYNKKTIILWDPIISASAGFRFHKKMAIKSLQEVFDTISIVTPNWEEMEMLSGKREPREGAKYVSKSCAVYLKGGHNAELPGVDYLWEEKIENAFTPESVSSYSKHGSGCVFSAALLAYLAKNESLVEACSSAKLYVEKFLNSSPGLLGKHYAS
jgi:hydroxymethylpyrimidine/phosphomethylpyrimidine kinase